MLNNIPLNKRTGVHAAICYMHVGMREEALKALEESYQRRGQDVSLWKPIREEFDTVQSDPRFQKMLRGLGIPQYNFRDVIPGRVALPDDSYGTNLLAALCLDHR